MFTNFKFSKTIFVNLIRFTIVTLTLKVSQVNKYCMCELYSITNRTKDIHMKVFFVRVLIFASSLQKRNAIGNTVLNM